MLVTAIISLNVTKVTFRVITIGTWVQTNDRLFGAVQRCSRDLTLVRVSEGNNFFST